MTTLKAAQSELRAIGLTLVKRDSEYVVYPRGIVTDSYFTGDIDDAIQTGRKIARHRATQLRNTAAAVLVRLTPKVRKYSPRDVEIVEDGIELVGYDNPVEVAQTIVNSIRPSTYAETHPTSGPDFFIQNEGTLYLLIPVTTEAKTWASDNLPEDAPRLGQNVAVEHRYILSIVDGIKDSGLTVAGR